MSIIAFLRRYVLPVDYEWPDLAQDRVDHLVTLNLVPAAVWFWVYYALAEDLIVGFGLAGLVVCCVVIKRIWRGC